MATPAGNACEGWVRCHHPADAIRHSAAAPPGARVASDGYFSRFTHDRRRMGIWTSCTPNTLIAAQHAGGGMRHMTDRGRADLLADFHRELLEQEAQLKSLMEQL